jgi:hypothetical protein
MKSLRLTSSDVDTCLLDAVTDTSAIFAGAGITIGDLRLLSDTGMAGAFEEEDPEKL